MLPIVWSQDARDDLSEIISFVQAWSPNAANRLADVIESSTWLLETHPLAYRCSDRIEGCREIVAHPNYVVVYKVFDTSVRIVAVFHSKADYPRDI